MNWLIFRKRSLFFSAGLVLIVLMVVYTYKQLELNTSEYHAKFTLHREDNLLAYLDVAKNTFEVRGLNDVRRIMDGAVETRIVDWYLVRDQNGYKFGKPIEMKDIQGLNYQPDLPFIDQFKSYKTVELMDGLTITIGVNKNREAYMKAIWEDQQKYIIQDVIVAVALPLFVFMFFLKDILKMLGVIKSGGAQDRLKSLEKISVRSQEALILKNSLQGYEVTLGKVEHERKLLSGQVLPGIQREILKNKKPPYEFNCTLVRMDINQFSTMFNQCDRDILLDQVHRYFEQVAVIVSGYGGYVHEFVGDEVLFYLKDEEVENSQGMALAVVRDIFEMTKKYSNTFRSKTQFSLIVKAACCHGTLRFGKLVDGFNLAGGILIESVRVLSQVQEKEENICLFSSVSLDQVSPVAELTKYGDFQLKGYADQITIYKVQVFHPQLHSKYWKSCQALVFWLQAVDRELAQNSSRALDLLNEVYQSPPYEIDSESARLLIRHLESVRGMRNEFETAALETLTSILRVLPDNEELKAYLNENAMPLLGSNSDRVRANIIEIGAGILNEEALKKIMLHPSARIRANALVALARQGLTSTVVGEFKSMIHSVNSEFVASGLYALQETLKWYLENNRVSLEANIELKRIYEYGISLRKNENISVARQARDLAKVEFQSQKVAV